LHGIISLLYAFERIESNNNARFIEAFSGIILRHDFFLHKAVLTKGYIISAWLCRETSTIIFVAETVKIKSKRDAIQ